MGQLNDRGWAWFAVAAEGWGHHGVTSSPVVAAAIPGSPYLSVLFCVSEYESKMQVGIIGALSTTFSWAQPLTVQALCADVKGVLC